MSGLVITLVLIAIAVVGGGIIAAIVLTSGSDTAESVEESSNIGGIAVYDERCRFSGTPIAVLHAFSDGGTGAATTGRINGILAAGNVSGASATDRGLIAQIRPVANTNALSEIVHDADFTGDGRKDDVLTADENRVAFYAAAGAVTNAGTGFNLVDAQNIALARDDWDDLGLTNDNITVGDANSVQANSNRVQLFVNRANDCWGLRRV